MPRWNIGASRTTAVYGLIRPAHISFAKKSSLNESQSVRNELAVSPCQPVLAQLPKNFLGLLHGPALLIRPGSSQDVFSHRAIGARQCPCSCKQSEAFLPNVDKGLGQAPCPTHVGLLQDCPKPQSTAKSFRLQNRDIDCASPNQDRHLSKISFKEQGLA